MPQAVHVVFAIAGIVCYIIVLVDMFRDEIWKGVLGLICGLYTLYYAVFEFEHEYKWAIVLGLLAGVGLQAVPTR